MTSPASRDALLQEFVTLRRGYGIRATNLRKRVGPELRRLCEVSPNADDPEIRSKVVNKLRWFSRELTSDDRRVIEIAIGAQRPARLLLLNVRTEQITNELKLTERTARRRIVRAFELLADEMLATRPSQADPEKGWRVTKFEALLRLDTPTPELVETRTIEATRDGLRTIVARMSLPKQESDNPAETNLVADLQQGARIVREERNAGHFRYVLELPKELNHGDEHMYTIAFRIPPGQPMRTHYAFVPMVACEEFKVRVRFDPDHLPVVVWKLDGLPLVAMTHRLTPGPPLKLDAAAETELTFHDLDHSYGYGLAWRHLDDGADINVQNG